MEDKNAGIYPSRTKFVDRPVGMPSLGGNTSCIVVFLVRPPHRQKRDLQQPRLLRR